MTACNHWPEIVKCQESPTIQSLVLHSLLNAMNLIEEIISIIGWKLWGKNDREKLLHTLEQDVEWTRINKELPKRLEDSTRKDEVWSYQNDYAIQINIEKNWKVPTTSDSDHVHINVHNQFLLRSLLSNLEPMMRDRNHLSRTVLCTFQLNKIDRYCFNRTPSYE